MFATLFTRRARHIRRRTPRVHDQRELLRRRPDSKPRRIISARKKIVVQIHVSIGKEASRMSEMPAAELAVGDDSRGVAGRGESEGQDEGGAIPLGSGGRRRCEIEEKNNGGES